MDDLDKQLAELQLITKGELKQNYAPGTFKTGKKIGPAVPPKPRKPQVYTNLPGVPRPYEKQPESIHSVHQQNTATYANQDGLIYSNILHDSKANVNMIAPNYGRLNPPVANDDLPPPPLEISPDYVQCNVPPPFPPPPIPSEIDDNLDDILPPPPPALGAQTPTVAGNVLYTPMGGGGMPNVHKTAYPQVDTNSTYTRQRDPQPYAQTMQYPASSVSPSNITYHQELPQQYETYNEQNYYANFNKAQPQVPTNYNKQHTNYNVYSNLAQETSSSNPQYGNHNYSNVQMTRNENPTYENTIIHQNTPSVVGRAPSRDYTIASDMHNSVLNYPGSSVSDYENQAQIMENRSFRAGSSASNYAPNSEFNARIDYDSDVVRQSTRDPSQGFRSASSASNYMPQHSFDRYNDQAESIYAPLRRQTDNDLPPPPPIMGEKALAPNLPPIIMCGNSNDTLGNMVDDIPPPASPVSSSYSELRRATDLGPHHHAMYNPYTPPSHISSTYESIYEPINPRPASQNSARSSGYSLYGSHQAAIGSGTLSSGGTLTSGNKQAKELEVDQLTDLLVQGLDSTDQDEVYGICVKCNEKIVGEENGCTAMDHFYHIDCFTCCQCNNNLQGKPFYSVEGQPYCEQDYLNTLEKCSVCVKPILDRILRATGKPYHPQCFTCIVCNKSLDGVPFTVDATNQIHCIEDFHKKFAPRCCVCKLPIMPEQGEDETVRVVALDRSFHIGCYKCEDCGLVLSSEAEGRGCYPLDDHVLCKSCNAKRVQALTSHMTTEL